MYLWQLELKYQEDAQPFERASASRASSWESLNMAPWKHAWKCRKWTGPSQEEAPSVAQREGVSWPIKITRQVERTCFKRGALLAHIPAPFPDGLVGLCLHKASGHHTVLQSAAPRASSLHIVSFDSLNYSLSPDKYYCSHKDMRNKLRETKYPAQCFIATSPLEPMAELEPSRPKPVVYWILLLFLHKNAEK